MAKQKAPLTRIQKSGSGHRYYLDGEPCPGVTTILGNGWPKPALVGWAANTTAEFVVNRLTTAQGATGVRIVADELVEDLRRVNAASKYPQRLGNDHLPRVGLTKILAGVRYEDRDTAANRGTAVHNLAETLARGEPAEVPEELAGHVDAYLAFLRDWEPENALLEVVGVNRRWRYMGKMDMIAEFPGKVWSSGPWTGRPVGRALLDIKTSRSGIFPDVALQLQAYRNVETLVADDGTETDMPEVDWVGAIHVRADGYDVIPFDTSGDDTDPAFRAFLYAKQIAEWNDKDTGAGARVMLPMVTPPNDTEETQ